MRSVMPGNKTKTCFINQHHRKTSPTFNDYFLDVDKALRFCGEAENSS